MKQINLRLHYTLPQAQLKLQEETCGSILKGMSINIIIRYDTIEEFNVE